MIKSRKKLLCFQTCDELEKFASNMEQQLNNDDVGRDLVSVNLLLKDHAAHEEEIMIRKQEVQELESRGKYSCCCCTSYD